MDRRVRVAQPATPPAAAATRVEHAEFSELIRPDDFVVDAAAGRSPSPPEVSVATGGAQSQALSFAEMEAVANHNHPGLTVVTDGVIGGGAAGGGGSFFRAASFGNGSTATNAFDGPVSTGGGAKSPSQLSLQDGYGGGGAATTNGFLPTHYALLGGSHSSGMGATLLTDDEEASLTRQVEFNARMFKFKLFNLLHMCATEDEQRDIDAEVKRLESLQAQQLVATNGRSSMPPRCSSQELLSATVGSLEGDATSLSDVSIQRPPTAGVAESRTPRALATPHAANLGLVGTTAATTTVALERARQLERLQASVNSHFRFAFEEVALRWHALQRRPFSLKIYHDVVKTEILKRERAEHRNIAHSKLANKLQAELDQVNAQLQRHQEAHHLSLRQFYQELLVLRNRVADLQRKLGSHEPIPELLECEERATEHADREAARRKQVDEEKHAAYMYKRAAEEVALLKHTLSERSNFIKALEHEVTSARADAITTKSELRRYMEDQEAIDVEFEQLVLKNEQRMHQLEHDNEALLGDVEKRDATIAQLETRVKQLAAALAMANANGAPGSSSSSSGGSSGAVAAQLLVDHGLQQGATALDPLVDVGAAHMSSGAFRHDGSPLAAQHSQHAAGSPSIALNQPLEATATAAVNDGDQQAPPPPLSPGKGGGAKKGKTAAAAVAAGNRMGSASGARKATAAAGGGAGDDVVVARLQAELKAAVTRADALQRDLDTAARQKLQLHRDAEESLNAANAAKKELAATKERLVEVEKAAQRKEEATEIERRNERAFLKKKVADLTESVSSLEKQLKDAERKLHDTQGSMLEDVMNMHRQMSIAEAFMSRHLHHDQLEALHRLLETASDDEDGEAGVSRTMHTPRTLHHFSVSKMLNKLRSGGSTGEEDADGGSQETAAAAAAVPTAPLDSAINVRRLFTKSKLSLGFVRSMAQKRLAEAGVPTSPGGANSTTDGMESPLLNAAAPPPATAPPELEVLNLKMVIEDLLAQHVAAKAVHEALRRDFGAFVEKYNDLVEEQRRREAEAPPAAVVALEKMRLARRQQQQQQSDGRGPGGDDEGADNVSSSDARRELSRRSRASPEMSILDEFPGVEHANEYYDVFEAFMLLRLQLVKLVDLCVAEAQRGALDPNDLDRMRVILNDKFIAFRAIEANAGAIVSKLHKKKDDILRRREEELELVLQSMQNISVTHPREAQQLLRVAKQAQSERARLAAERPIVFQVEVQRPATAMGGGMGGGGAATPFGGAAHYAATRRPLASPDVTVAGAPALMSVRKRGTSASVSRK